ncbi:MAG TPA: FAD-dependent oxidoreductase [Thermomicrobiales bacterium]|jgi:ribulose 1,5-bisphosphate synthetase/thiazole synthase|nr:FAD-dependent oxidoreductase [Thermomicrobiales bacterium]
MRDETPAPSQTGSLTITREIDVPLAVVGGGLAGLCAAIAAARRGVRVALIQERPVLGGNSSSEIRVHPVGASQHGKLRDARETGLIEEIFLDVRDRSYGLRQVNGQHYPMWDVVLTEKAEAEPNLELFLNTRVVGVETADDHQGGYATRVTALVAAQQATEEVIRVRPQAVIDATGDGFVALQAGAPFRIGREARAEFDESWAPDEADDIVLGSTIMFAARDVGRPVPFQPPAWAHSFPDEESLPFRYHEQFESGYWWLEWGGRLDTIRDNETIRRELHAAVFGVWDHIKNHCTVPGVREKAATWAMDWIGHIPGKRESRRFEGDHILTEGDIYGGMWAVPDDVVTYGGWAIDLHAPDGVYSPDRPCTQPPLPGLYGIPLRSLYSRSVSNLFLAGRDISQTHVAHGSTRVMKTCAVIGEAAGTAAAIAIAAGQTPRGVATDPVLLASVQQALLRQGAYLPLRRNEDPDDLARRDDVRIDASSTAPLRLDDDGESAMGWEDTGISASEHNGLIAERRDPVMKVVPLVQPVAQLWVLSADHLDAVTLRLRSDADGPVTARLHIHQADQLRDLRALDDTSNRLATLEASVTPGEASVRFAPDSPLAVRPDAPVALILEPFDGGAWLSSSQEPPGTQSAQWDPELGYWRWLHGTFHTIPEPASYPFGAHNIATGVTRPEIGTNVWVSDPVQALPQWVDLHWTAPVTVGRVELTFDSQLSGWVWEGRFPLVARDYEIELCDPATDQWQVAETVTDNAQRRRIHTFTPRETTGLRVRISATNGGATARLVEARAYAE